LGSNPVGAVFPGWQQATTLRYLRDKLAMIPPFNRSHHHALDLPAAEPASIHVCILGGGFGGLYCALDLQNRLQRLPQPVRVTLVEPRARFTFTPLLYELLTDELKPWEIAPSYKELLRSTAISQVSDWAESIDLDQSIVRLRHGDVLSYDYLVVALGSRLRPPTVRGCQTHALPFATIDNEWALEKRLTALEVEPGKPTIRVVVAGAGPSGVELACKLADRLGHRGHITVLERRSVILRSSPVKVQRAAARAFLRRGIAYYTQAEIEAVTAEQVIYHHQAQRHQLPTDLVLWTVGTVPHPWLGNQPGSQNFMGQCQVRSTLQRPDHGEVFVLGDMAEMPAPGRERAPMTAQAAFQAAPVVAHNVVALITQRPLKLFNYHHLGIMMTLGRGEAVVNGFGLCLTGWLGALARRWAYWLRLPTMAHRWRVLKSWVSRLLKSKQRRRT
jgi:NADH:ubiquinone reductase (non-electrogenic)